jgi:hypothetical protein
MNPEPITTISHPCKLALSGGQIDEKSGGAGTGEGMPAFCALRKRPTGAALTGELVDL